MKVIETVKYRFSIKIPVIKKTYSYDEDQRAGDLYYRLGLKTIFRFGKYISRVEREETSLDLGLHVLSGTLADYYDRVLVTRLDKVLTKKQS